MELGDYVRILRKRWWIVVVAVAFTAASALLFAEFAPREYTSTAEIIIKPARPDWGLAQAAKIHLRTYMTEADSDKYAENVITELGLGLTPGDLRAKAYFAAEDDRMVIKIEVEDYDGDQANDIARTWANYFIRKRDEDNARQRKEDRVYAELRDEPRYRQSWPPSRGVMGAAGGVFGLVVAGVVIFFLEWLEAGIVRTPRDLEHQLNLTVVGAIPPTD